MDKVHGIKATLTTSGNVYVSARTPKVKFLDEKTNGSPVARTVCGRNRGV